MLNVIVVADFPLEKTGILSNVVGLLSSLDAMKFRLYSDQSISVNGVVAQPVRDRGNAADTIVFTHLEYRGLRHLLDELPDAKVHVGDWPGIYWTSVLKAGRWAKGIAGMIRFRYRIAGLSRKTKFVFVSREDTDAAIANFFAESRYVPIGINPPVVPRRHSINTQEVCFSGNFRYEPNRLAAISLINCLRNAPGIKLVFVGYYANDLRAYDDVIELHDNVPSVVNFLAARRPIYVSLLSIGAGAKNKILDAALAGCPIICTHESLDESVFAMSSIQTISDDSEVEEKCKKIAAEIGRWNENSESVADTLARTRSWQAIAHLMFDDVEVANVR